MVEGLQRKLAPTKYKSLCGVLTLQHHKLIMKYSIKYHLLRMDQRKSKIGLYNLSTKTIKERNEYTGINTSSK